MSICREDGQLLQAPAPLDGAPAGVTAEQAGRGARRAQGAAGGTCGSGSGEAAGSSTSLTLQSRPLRDSRGWGAAQTVCLSVSFSPGAAAQGKGGSRSPKGRSALGAAGRLPTQLWPSAAAHARTTRGPSVVSLIYNFISGYRNKC